jgi:hypothetical protein
MKVELLVAYSDLQTVENSVFYSVEMLVVESELKLVDMKVGGLDKLMVEKLVSLKVYCSVVLKELMLDENSAVKKASLLVGWSVSNLDVLMVGESVEWWAEK